MTPLCYLRQPLVSHCASVCPLMAARCLRCLRPAILTHPPPNILIVSTSAPVLRPSLWHRSAPEDIVVHSLARSRTSIGCDILPWRDVARWPHGQPLSVIGVPHRLPHRPVAERCNPEACWQNQALPQASLSVRYQSVGVPLMLVVLAAEASSAASGGHISAFAAAFFRRCTDALVHQAQVPPPPPAALSGVRAFGHLTLVVHASSSAPGIMPLLHPGRSLPLGDAGWGRTP